MCLCVSKKIYVLLKPKTKTPMREDIGVSQGAKNGEIGVMCLDD